MEVGTPGTPAAGAAPAAGETQTTTYTQAQLDAAVAAAKTPTTPATPPTAPKPGDKVNVQELATLRQMQAKIAELAQGKDVTTFLDEIKPLQDSLLTAEDRARQLLDQATKNEETAKAYKTRYESSLIERSVIDAALPKASTPAAAKLLLKELKDYASVDEKTGAVSFKMPVTENGQTVTKLLNAEQAVALLESKPAEFGPLFKSFASTGTGAKGNEHGFKDANGKLSIEQLSKLTFEEYSKIRKENPAALGLA